MNMSIDNALSLLLVFSIFIEDDSFKNIFVLPNKFVIHHILLVIKLKLTWNTKSGNGTIIFTIR